MSARRMQASIVEVMPLGEDLGRVDLEADGIGRNVEPGQFAMIEAPNAPQSVLLRAYSYFSVSSDDRASFLVKAAGSGTRALLQASPGAQAIVLGPLGNAFPEPQGECWAVAGGVGAAPFGGLAGLENLRVIFGARNVSEVGFARALKEMGGRVDIVTDDGSSGLAGTSVDRLAELLSSSRPDMLFTCGPTAMMEAVAQVAYRHEVPCWVSLEARMGCGFGVCRSCVHRDATGGWRCICEDGPVYPAETIFAPSDNEPG